VARLGGDEFAAVLGGPAIDSSTGCPAGRLAAALATPMQIAGESLIVTASVGMVPVYASAGLAEALSRADAAMYQVKTGRRRSYCPVDPDAAVAIGGRPNSPQPTPPQPLTPQQSPGPQPAGPDQRSTAHSTPPWQLVDTTQRSEAGGP